MRQSLTAAEKRNSQQAKARLLEMVQPGDTLHTILRQVSRSGMSRHISVTQGTNDNTYLVARVLQERVADDGGIVIGGCGMDMGFETVYRLGYALWPDGFTCPGETCHSNDHFNGERNRKPHKHNNGGYALRQVWL